MSLVEKGRFLCTVSQSTIVDAIMGNFDVSKTYIAS